MAIGTKTTILWWARKLSFTAKILHGAVCFTSSHLGQISYKIQSLNARF